MALVTWPWTFAPEDIMPFLNPRNTRGSTAMDGTSQVIGSAAQRWEFDYINIPVPAERVKLWRVLDTRSQGMLNPIVIPVWEGDRIPQIPGAPYTSDEYWRASGPFGKIRHADGSLFGDGSGYYQPTNSATLASFLARGATMAQIDSANAIEAGTLFSIGFRLYTVSSVEEVSGSVHTIKFMPPAREAANTGDAIEFDRPVCKVRLKSDDEMRMALKRGRYGFGDLGFLEDVT